ncbi:hypothetical protein HDV05_006268 [Chytridiales sp. JEL 0842]|nr:hypothetical protein HDV05_006268 [Chytridiales sp. JEL 0842]
MSIPNGAAEPLSARRRFMPPTFSSSSSSNSSNAFPLHHRPTLNTSPPPHPPPNPLKRKRNPAAPPHPAITTLTPLCTLPSKTGVISTTHFNASCTLAAAGGQDGKIHIWSTPSSSSLSSSQPRYVLGGFEGVVTCVKFGSLKGGWRGPLGKEGKKGVERLVAGAGYDCTVRVFRIPDGEEEEEEGEGEVVNVFRGHKEPVLDLDWCPVGYVGEDGEEGVWVASVDRGGVLMVWDVYTGIVLESIRLPAPAPLSSIHLKFRPPPPTSTPKNNANPFNVYLLSTTSSTLHVIDLTLIPPTPNEPLPRESSSPPLQKDFQVSYKVTPLDTPHFPFPITAFQFSSSGFHLVTCSEKILCLWDTAHLSSAQRFGTGVQVSKVGRWDGLGRVGGVGFVDGEGGEGVPRCVVGEVGRVVVWDAERVEEVKEGKGDEEGGGGFERAGFVKEVKGVHCGLVSTLSVGTRPKESGGAGEGGAEGELVLLSGSTGTGKTPGEMGDVKLWNLQ